MAAPEHTWAAHLAEPMAAPEPSWAAPAPEPMAAAPEPEPAAIDTPGDDPFEPFGGVMQLDDVLGADDPFAPPAVQSDSEPAKPMRLTPTMVMKLDPAEQRRLLALLLEKGDVTTDILSTPPTDADQDHGSNGSS
jgi:hypothetical protein